MKCGSTKARVAYFEELWQIEIKITESPSQLSRINICTNNIYASILFLFINEQNQLYLILKLIIFTY